MTAGYYRSDAVAEASHSSCGSAGGAGGDQRLSCTPCPRIRQPQCAHTGANRCAAHSKLSNTCTSPARWISKVRSYSLPQVSPSAIACPLTHLPRSPNMARLDLTLRLGTGRLPVPKAPSRSPGRCPLRASRLPATMPLPPQWPDGGEGPETAPARPGLDASMARPASHLPGDVAPTPATEPSARSGHPLKGLRVRPQGGDQGRGADLAPPAAARAAAWQAPTRALSATVPSAAAPRHRGDPAPRGGGVHLRDAWVDLHRSRGRRSERERRATKVPGVAAPLRVG